jgi:predicted lipid-binding transport protein (Tim44 family)
MLCPNCGTTTTTEHKFCRHCGMNLEPVSRALAAHLSLGGVAAVAVERGTALAREAERRNVRRLTGGLAAGFLVVLFGVLLMAFTPNPAFGILGFASAVIGIVASLAAIFSTLRRAADGVVAETPTTHAPDVTAAAETGRLLHESTFKPVPSVTERTTDLLGVEARRRKPHE